MGDTLAFAEIVSTRLDALIKLQERTEWNVSNLAAGQEATQAMLDALSQQLAQVASSLRVELQQQQGQPSPSQQQPQQQQRGTGGISGGVALMPSCLGGRASQSSMSFAPLSPTLESSQGEQAPPGAVFGRNRVSFGMLDSGRSSALSSVPLSSRRSSRRASGISEGANSMELGPAGSIVSCLKARPSISGLSAASLNTELHEIEAVIEAHLQGKHEEAANLSVQQQLWHHGHLATAEEEPSYSFMLNPFSFWRSWWDVLSIFLLLCEVVGTPIVLAWDVPMVGLLRVYSLGTLIFWTVDIFLSFMTGFYSQGKLVMRPAVVAKRYLRTWFVIDLLVVVTDIFSHALSADGEAGGSGTQSTAILRLSKMSRFIRLARLLRLARVSEIIGRVAEKDPTHSLEMVHDTMMPALMIVVMNHLLACTWYVVPQVASSDTGGTWLDTEIFPGQSPDTYEGAPMLYQYTTSLHWSMTQMTPGSMQVFPQNSNERIVNCLCLLIGMVVFTNLISSLSAKLVARQRYQRDRYLKITILRRFLRRKAVGARLALVVQMEAERGLSETSRKPLVIGDVAAVSILSATTRRKLKAEIGRVDVVHPIFRFWAEIDPNGLQGLCNDATDFVALPPLDNLFFPRNSCDNAFVVTEGKLNYTREHSFAPPDPCEVCDGRFFCEQALWSKWRHVGEMTASTGCELMTINSTSLGKHLQTSRIIHFVVGHYGKEYYAALVKAIESPDNYGEFDDLSVPGTEFETVVLQMPMQCKRLISSVALRKALHRLSRRSFLRTFPTASDVHLDEVREGSCIMTLNISGDVERLVVMQALALDRGDGRRLTFLGRWLNGQAYADCRLPARNQLHGESPMEAQAEVLESFALDPLWFAPLVDNREPELLESFSERTKIQSRTWIMTSCAALVAEEKVLCFQGLVVSPGGDPPPRRSFREGSLFRPSFIFGQQASLLPFEVFLLAQRDGGMYLCAWVQPKEMLYMQTPEGKHMLQHCLDNISVPTEAEELALARVSVASI